MCKVAPRANAKYDDVDPNIPTPTCRVTKRFHLEESFATTPKSAVLSIILARVNYFFTNKVQNCVYAGETR